MMRAPTVVPVLALVAIAAILVSAPIRAKDHGEINPGEDETRPLSRFDLRYRYSNLPPAAQGNGHVITLRVDQPFALSADWQLAARVDLPIHITDAVGADDPGGGHTTSGLGDLLLQGLVAHAPITSRFAWAAGARLLLPTASEDRMGSGRWQILPTVGARYFTPEITKGSWVGFVGRYDVDVGGTPDRQRISDLQVAPQLYIQLPDTWFLQSFPSTDIRYNFAEERPGDTGRWFVPFDFIVGRMLSESITTSLEASVPIVNEYQLYDFKIEGRIGLFF